MSNIKSIKIRGEVAFDAHRQDTDAGKTLSSVYAECAGPSSGLMLSWGTSSFRTNAWGGQTAVYKFELYGCEAVSFEYLAAFKAAIEASPFGLVFEDRSYDWEEAESLKHPA